MSKPNSHFYEFGPFRIDTLKRILLRDGEVAPITPKAFDILSTLIERNGEALSKDDLMNAVWPDTVVEENNLLRNISALRKALGEKPDEHRYIVTIPGRGYRFVAEVKRLSYSGAGPVMIEQYPSSVAFAEPISAGAPSDAESLPGKPPSRVASHKIRAIIALAILVAAGGLLASWRRSRPPASYPFRQVKLTRLTNTGNVLLSAISPDGEYIVYVADEGGKQSLWLRHMATASSARITPPAAIDYWGLTFKPDGQFIYYVAFETNQADPAIYRIPILGGVAPQKVSVGGGSGITFSPEGGRIAYTHYSSRKKESQLRLLNADGAEERKLAVRAYPDFFRDLPRSAPSWSPDGKVIAAAAGIFGKEGLYPVEIEVASGAQRPLTARQWFDAKQTAWLSDGSGLVMVAKEEAASPYQLWFISYPAGEVRRVTNDLTDYYGVSLSQAGALVTAQRELLTGIWLTPDGRSNSLRQILSVASRLSGDAGFAWTPDNRIVYCSNASGMPELWVVGADGAGAKRLTIDGRVRGSVSVSPDGRSLTFASDRGGIPHIWQAGIDGAAPKQLTFGKGELNAQFSPNGRRVIFQQFMAAGEPVLYEIPVYGGEAARLTNGGASLGPAISPDGKLIAYFYLDAKVWGLAVIPFAGGEPIKRFPIPSSARSRVTRWTPDGRSLAYIDDRDGVSNIWSQPLDGGPPRQITQFTEGHIHYFDWSRDGRRLALARGNVISDLVLITSQRE
jgi:Tol biopolymer transport system component/DNA-binding winged helix-turn-helix (wHTH) protein